MRARKRFRKLKIKTADNQINTNTSGPWEKDMRVLTEENKCFLMNELPTEPVDIRYGVLDYSNVQTIDHYFIPLIFLESFTAPAADLKIGPYRIQMPLDWSIVVGDKNLGDLEIINITHLNDREFETFCFNPISGFRPEFHKVEILNLYPDMKWFFPKLKFGHVLVVPLMEHADVSHTKRPDGKIIDNVNMPCAYFVKETSKLPDVLDITKIF